jgi:hypothetical protein
MNRTALLVWVRGETRGVLYVFGKDGSYSQMFGAVDELRAIAGTRYPDTDLHETPLNGIWDVTQDDSPSCEATSGQAV